MSKTWSAKQILLIAAVWTAWGCTNSNPEQASSDGRSCSLAIEHVSVIPMDAERVVQDQTVRIAAGRILSLSPASAAGPVCDRIVDGRGKYLAPGLNDMHVHVESEAIQRLLGMAPAPIPFDDVLFNYLANGVTGIRVMAGTPDLLAFRRSEHGPAPLMMIASPMFSGDPPAYPGPLSRVLTMPEQAAGAVNEYADAGYDLIKVRENIAPEVLEAIGRAAQSRNLEVDGHIASTASLLAIGRRGFAHISQLSARVQPNGPTPAKIAEELNSCRCYVTSTLVLEDSAAQQLRNYSAMLARPSMAFVHPLIRNGRWAKERNPYFLRGQNPESFDRIQQVNMELVLEFRRHNIPILAGTDSLLPMIIPGESMHDELALLANAGLSPYEALSAATRTPAQLFDQFDEVGTVVAGNLANLVLVSENPLLDVRALRRPEAVIVRGVLLDRAMLDKRLAEIASRFAGRQSQAQR